MAGRGPGSTGFLEAPKRCGGGPWPGSTGSTAFLEAPQPILRFWCEALRALQLRARCVRVQRQYSAGRALGDGECGRGQKLLLAEQEPKKSRRTRTEKCEARCVRIQCGEEHSGWKLIENGLCVLLCVVSRQCQPPPSRLSVHCLTQTISDPPSRLDRRRKGDTLLLLSTRRAHRFDRALDRAHIEPRSSPHRAQIAPRSRPFVTPLLPHSIVTGRVMVTRGAPLALLTRTAAGTRWGT